MFAPDTADASFDTLIAPHRATAREPRKRIAVFRALQLGDMLCALPALRALRRAEPHAEITLVGMPWAHDFVKRFHRYLDAFIDFPGHRDFPEQKVRHDEVPKFYEETRRHRFDLALQLHGSGPTVNQIVARTGARELAGFYLTEEDRPIGRFTPWPQEGHEVRRLLRLTEFLGMETQGEHLEFPTTAQDEEALERLPEWRQLDSPFVVVHPGARLRSRRWMPERFAWVADSLAEKGYDVVLTGSNDEHELIEAMRNAMRHTPIVMASRTTLGALAVLLKRAALLVSNDTGISHVATATGTPSVVLVLGSEPARWAPLDTHLHDAVAHPVACRPCYHELCPIGHDCAVGLTADTVIDHAEAMLERRSSCVLSAS